MAEGGASFNTSNYGFITSPSPFVSGQLTFGMLDAVQWGFAYDHNFLSYSNNGGNGSLNFYGATVRVSTLVTGFFIDGQAGIDIRDSSDSSFSWGIGAGYTIPLNFFFDFGPRFSYRSVPDSGIERSLVDAGLFLTLKIL